MIYIGIDPGLSGAVGIISDYEGAGGGVTVSVYDTPTFKVDTKNKFNVTAMSAMLKPFIGVETVLVVLELVHSMPKQGVASSFSFGEGLGMWKGIIGAYSLPLEMVSPQRWKKAMLADQGKEKDASRFKAMQIFPELTEKLSRKKDDGRAEAILMAEYGRRLRKG